MKKVLSLVLALAMLLGAVSAVAETQIDGRSPRNITIHSAGLNDDADTCFYNDVSPTTGRRLSEIEIPGPSLSVPSGSGLMNGFVGFAVTGIYQPIMVQISNSDNGMGSSVSVPQYRSAPVNGIYADIVYEALQKKSGTQSRFTYVFSDLIPDLVGFVRSTRLTHVRLRAEWNCAFVASGWNYSLPNVLEEWKRTGVGDPRAKKGDNARSEENPGLVYIGDLNTSQPWWGKYMYRVFWKNQPDKMASADTEVFNLAGIVSEVVPKNHVPTNHTFLFTDEIPAEGDEARIVYVNFGDAINTNSRLEYDPSTNSYIRYMHREKGEDMPYRTNNLIDAKVKKVSGQGKNINNQGVSIQGMEAGEPITFNNVIIQSVDQRWEVGAPDPTMTGTGNADFFMGGKHIAGMWERTDLNNTRTVFYGPDGNEIKLQRGRTLIIIMCFTEENRSVSYE